MANYIIIFFGFLNLKKESNVNSNTKREGVYKTFSILADCASSGRDSFVDYVVYTLFRYYKNFDVTKIIFKEFNFNI